jgi:hypothetical protein
MTKRNRRLGVPCIHRDREPTRLLTIDELAALLRRTPKGLRGSLARNSELARLLQPARLKIGRRVLFQANAIDGLLTQLSAKEG